MTSIHEVRARDGNDVHSVGARETRAEAERDSEVVYADGRVTVPAGRGRLVRRERARAL